MNASSTITRKIVATTLGLLGLAALASTGATVLDDMHWPTGPTSTISTVADGETCTSNCDDDMHW